MYEYVPFVEGQYLTYQEYIALLMFMVCFIVTVLTYILNWRLKFESIIVKIVKLILSIFSIIFGCLCITTLSAFNIIPLWASMMLIFVFLGINIKFLTTRPDVKESRYTFEYRLIENRNTQIITISLVTIIGIFIPLFFKDTCICLNEKNYELSTNLSFLNIDGSFNSWMTRSYIFCHDVDKPCHVYATLPEQASTEVFVTVHTHESVVNPISLKYWAQNSTHSLLSEVFRFKDLEQIGQRRVHTFYIKNLYENKNYQFNITINDKMYHYYYKPLNQKIFKFVAGGDAGNSPNSYRMWRRVTEVNPDVIFIGGDIAYDNNAVSCYWTWDLFLNQWDLLSFSVNRLVPIIFAGGNHDFGLNPNSKRQLTLNRHHFNPAFLTLFPQHLNEKGLIPQIVERRPYFAHRFGQKAILFSLDSGYQTNFKEQGWFMRKILETEQFEWKFAQYHNPIYSSCEFKKLEEYVFIQGTLEWVSVFDKFEFSTIFENHKHTIKRSKRIKGNLENPDGTLYLGDGSWGAEVSTCQKNEHSYLMNMEYDNSVWVGEVRQDEIIYRAMNKDGVILDHYILSDS